MLRILRQVAGALAEAHDIGLIHRDIKPANVILMAERGSAPDVAKVVDFGLVKELDTIEDSARERDIAGTPHYLAPEMISSPDHIGPASDLYSLGCLGYYLVTGETVFQARTVAEVCPHHLHSQPLNPAVRTPHHVPESLTHLLMACLEKAPERRPTSAQEFIDRLDQCRDVDEWTNEMARAWWKSYDAARLARVRAGSRVPTNRSEGGDVDGRSVTRTVREVRKLEWVSPSG